MEERMNIKRASAFLLFLSGLTAVPLLAAEADLKAHIRTLSAIPAVTGSEDRMAVKIREMLSGRLNVETDNLGSIYARSGKGEPGLSVLAPLDEFGWFVSGVTADGYLRLDRAAAPPHALFDSFLMGHAVVISTRSGLQNGVVAQPAMHLLTRERRDELQKGISLDLVYVDVGARSEEEVKDKGIEHLDAVSFRPDLVTLANDLLSGPGLGHKAICAALAMAAEKTAAARTTPAAYFIWMAQSRFNLRGGGARVSLGATRAQMRLKPKTVLLLEILAADRGDGTPSVGKGPVVWEPQEKLSRLRAALEKMAGERGIALQHQTGGESPLLRPFLATESDALILALPVKFNQTPSEVVSLRDVQSLVELVADLGQKGGDL